MNVRKLAQADTKDDSGNTLVLTGVFLAFLLVMSVLSPKVFLSVGTMRSLFVQLPEFGIYALLTVLFAFWLYVIAWPQRKKAQTQ